MPDRVIGTGTAIMGRALEAPVGDEGEALGAYVDGNFEGYKLGSHGRQNRTMEKHKFTTPPQIMECSRG